MAVETRTRARVLLLFGGHSDEHEPSVRSARAVLAALDRERYEPVLVGIAPGGSWHVQDEARWSSDEPSAPTVDEGGPEVSLPLRTGSDRARAMLRVGDERQAVDVAFSMLPGADPKSCGTAGLWELAGLPYVGTGPLGVAISDCRSTQRRLLEQAELPVLPYRIISRRHWSGDEARSEAIGEAEALGYPLEVQPSRVGDGPGRRVRDRSELAAALQSVLDSGPEALIGRWVEPARSLRCAVLGNDQAAVSVPGELGDAGQPDAGQHLDIPARLYHAEHGTVQLVALRGFRALAGAGLALVDLLLTDAHDLYLRDVHAFPSLAPDAPFPQLWEATGRTFGAVVTELLELAFERHGTSAPTCRSRRR